MGIIIKRPGISSTIQDLGRTGARSLGINPGGVMDTAAARIVNTILGNEKPAAVLEVHFPAAEIEFDAGIVFAIGGGDFGAKLDGEEIRNWTSTRASEGSTLKFARKRSGSRSYVGIQNGFQVESWLGSASTNLAVGVGGFFGRRLMAGDRIACGDLAEFTPFTVGRSLVPRYSRYPTVRVIPGAEFGFLTATSERDFLKEGFTLTNDCDRMGYRLSGKPLHLLDDRSMISSAVCFGTIQLLPDGQMIILMADHQTSGGYPRIANVISVDLPVLAQCGPGDGVSFEMVSIEEAERLALQFEAELNFLRVGCRLQKQC